MATAQSHFVMTPRALALILALAAGLGCLYYWVALLHTQSAVMAAARHRDEERVTALNEAIAQGLDATLRSVDAELRQLRAA